MSAWRERVVAGLGGPLRAQEARQVMAQAGAMLTSVLGRYGPPALFVAQWIGLLTLSWMQYRHFALTVDFAYYHQAWSLIARGVLNPHLLIDGPPFYKNHLELLLWVLAPLYWLWPHSFWLLALQDSAVVGTGWIAWTWIRHRLTERVGALALRRFLILAGLFMVLADPWMVEAITFDFHFEDIAAFFLMAAAWSFVRERNRLGFLFAFLVASTGNVSMTYLVALGASCIWLERGRRLRGWSLVLLGMGGFLLASHLGVHLGANVSPGPSHPSPTAAHAAPAGGAQLLLGIITHPGVLWSHLWPHRLNIYANLAPEGIIGALTPWGLPIAGLLAVENNLAASVNFSLPGFQSFPMYGFILVGSMEAITRLARWRQRLGVGLTVALLANVFGWAIVWIPHVVPSAFVDGVSAQGARQLQRLRRMIPPSAEVVASQGILGRFAGRRAVDVFLSSIPIVRRRVYFIVSPYQGIDTASAAQELGRVAFLSRLPGIRRLGSRADIWAFAWTPPPGMHTLTVGTPRKVPAWTLATQVGTRILTGPYPDWHMATGSQAPGYVVQQAYWRLPDGRYQAKVRLADTGPAQLQIWNATAGVLLEQSTLPATNGVETVTVPVVIHRQYPRHLYGGVGWFRYQPTPPATTHDQFEVRVYTPGNEIVNVYALSLNPVRP